MEIGFVAATGSQAGLEPGQTDEDGEFYATYPADVVKKLIEAKAQFSLVVRKGRTIIHRDPETFRQGTAVQGAPVESPAVEGPTVQGVAEAEVNAPSVNAAPAAWAR